MAERAFSKLALSFLLFQVRRLPQGVPRGCLDPDPLRRNCRSDKRFAANFNPRLPDIETIGEMLWILIPQSLHTSGATFKEMDDEWARSEGTMIRRGMIASLAFLSLSLVLIILDFPKFAVFAFLLAVYFLDLRTSKR